jgi:hypothetical protein
MISSTGRNVKSTAIVGAGIKVNGGLAQSVERWSCIPKVRSSTLLSSTFISIL